MLEFFDLFLHDAVVFTITFFVIVWVIALIFLIKNC